MMSVRWRPSTRVLIAGASGRRKTVPMLLLLSLVPGLGEARAQAQTALPGLHVSGNTLVDSNGTAVILRGVDRSGSEYACTQGWGFFDGDNVLNDDSQAPLMKQWNVNAVLLGINEDCWLGINGVPAAYGGTNYINAITHEVATLESYGIYPVISLFWEAPGTQQATDQTAMPDNDHAPALWQSVATTFKNDPRVIFRLKEEPYPAGNTDGTSAWQCWKTGDVQYNTSNTLVPVSQTVTCSEGYKAVGMQSLINIIRGTGATNVIQVPGVEYANSMTHFLDSAYRVTDTLAAPQLMGVVDVYPNGNLCGSVTCYSSEYAPVIAQMPFVAGEFGESVDGNTCTISNVDALMSWFDQHGAGYLAWTWDTWGQCLQLITSYSTGAPNGSWGTDYKNHLAVLASSTPKPATHFSVAAPGSATAGTPVNVTVTAVDASGKTATGYTGTIHFSSGDSQAVLPANYTFSAGDYGTHTFSVTLKTAGPQIVTVSDTGNAALVGASGTIGVGSGSLSKLLLTAPSSTASGAPIQVTVAAADVYGNTTPSYTGTVHVQSSDAQAMLPPNYSFTSADKGFHTFSITLRTIGSQSVTAADTTTTSLLGSVGVAVNASTTIPLTAGAGWNLVGGDPLSIWSDATAAWSWNASTGTWSSLTSSSPAQSEGTGAWEQLSSTAAAASHSVTAQVCSSAVSLPILPHRWNMVGNPCSVAVSLPAGIHAFWWDPSRQTYVPATTIAAGAAAWILAPAGSVSLTPG